MRWLSQSHIFRSMGSGANLGISSPSVLRKDSVSKSFPANPTMAELFGKNFFLSEIKERGDELALGEVSGGSEDHHDTRAGSRGSFVVIHCSWRFPDSEPGKPERFQWPDFFSTCPPNWKRIAESSLSAKSSSPREVKR